MDTLELDMEKCSEETGDDPKELKEFEPQIRYPENARKLEIILSDAL